MRKETKAGKRKKRQKALKLFKKGEDWKAKKFLKQANKVPYGTATKSNY